MDYPSFKFFLPPRPENKVQPGLLHMYDKGQNIAQAKMNGTYNFIGISPEKNMVCLKRDGTEHRNWAPGPENLKAFANLPGDDWYVFCAELMHSKVADAGLKNINYIHDVIVDSGEMLIGSTYEERHYRLQSLFPSQPAPDADHYRIIDKHTWLATTYKHDFKGVYDRLIEAPEIEGLVIKNLKTKLSIVDMGRGMVKVRKPTKNYGF